MEKLILINLLEPPEVKFADWIEISKQFTVTLSVAWQTLLWLYKREQESKYTIHVCTSIAKPSTSRNPRDQKEKGIFQGAYRKIPKISPGAYIFQRPFLKGLFLEGLLFGRAYLRREICISKSIGLVS